MYEALGLAALRRFDPERAHRLAILALRGGLVPLGGAVTSARLATKLAGLTFANPVGLAAGFDKNAEAVGPLGRAGFGFVEVGAATPRPQPGNPRPRLFRLTEDHAVINRFGFNNEGADAIASRLAAAARPVPIGINLGANKDSDDKGADFASVLRTIGPHVDFATVNVSSPNTEKLRDLQGAEALNALLKGVMAARTELDRHIPVFLKIAPDLNAQEIADLVGTAKSNRVDAIIATNTTLDRQGLRSAHANEAGGLSGAPLFEKSTRVLAQVCQLAGPDFPVIGVGGIGSTQDALTKIEVGAHAVQLYSAMVYKGLSLAARIARGLDEKTHEAAVQNVAELRGRKQGDWL